MGLHLIKLAVGAESFSHLRERQDSKLVDGIGANEKYIRHLTRSMPKRADELLVNGSIYWVIKRAIRARQRIVDIEKAVNYKGVTCCALILEPGLVAVRARPHRPFQGWRYLEHKDAPPDDIGFKDEDDELPQEMADELRELGLL